MMNRSVRAAGETGKGVVPGEEGSHETLITRSQEFINASLDNRSGIGGVRGASDA